MMDERLDGQASKQRDSQRDIDIYIDNSHSVDPEHYIFNTSAYLQGTREQFDPSSTEAKHTYHLISEQRHLDIFKKHYVRRKTEENKLKQKSRFLTVVLVKIPVYWNMTLCPM